MQTLMEKIAAKPRKKKPAGGRKARDLYAPDMSKAAPGTKPKAKPAPKAKTKLPTLHDKVDKLTKQVSAGAKKAVTKKPHIAKKLGLIGAGVAGVGVAGGLIHKVRQKRLADTAE